MPDGKFMTVMHFSSKFQLCAKRFMENSLRAVCPRKDRQLHRQTDRQTCMHTLVTILPCPAKGGVKHTASFITLHPSSDANVCPLRRQGPRSVCI